MGFFESNEKIKDIDLKGERVFQNIIATLTTKRYFFFNLLTKMP